MNFSLNGIVNTVARHWWKFGLLLILVIAMFATAIWAANNERSEENYQDYVRATLLDCSTPGPPEHPNRCFEEIQQYNAERSQRSIQYAVELLAIDTDCRLRRTLWGMPAPEERNESGQLIPCPDQTPKHVYPGDGTRPITLR